MVYVPAGTVWMGCHRDGSRECDADEQPGHEVRVSAFYIGRTEVSVVDYARCVLDRDCGDEGLDGYAITGTSLVVSTYCNWRQPKRERHPLNCVSHAQATRYCQWRDGRLPTEAEWERAARGDDRRRYPWGDEPASCALAVMADDKGNGCGKNGTWPVGRKPRDISPFGAMDMAGNVREWVADWYDKRYYRKKVVSDPHGPDHGARRSARGGGWGNTVSRFLRASARDAEHPNGRNMHLGFRCAKSVPKTESP